MKAFILHLKNFDWIIVTSALFLSGIGLVSIYSSSSARGDLTNFNKQAIFFAIGFVIMIILSFFDWRSWREAPYLILSLYFLCILALAGLFFFAPEIRGTKSWYKIGAVTLDPIEPTKIVLIILLAKYFSMRHVEMYKIRHILLSGFYIIVPAILMFFQPNLGPILIVVGMWLGILIISGIKTKHFILLGLLGVVILTLGWSFLLKDYQKARIMGFVLPQRDPLGINWSQNQSKIAIGSGGLFGKGIGKGTQTQYGFLPASHNDFIFASIAEEMGFAGVSLLFLLFLIMFWRIVRIALNSQTNFPRLFASGFAILLAVQIFINIGMNLGILPIIGIPLPFVSYGGSGLIMVFSALGILQNIKINT